jgi:hypothetical protein
MRGKVSREFLLVSRPFLTKMVIKCAIFVAQLKTYENQL